MAQWNKKTQSFLPNGTSIFETVTLADKFGAQSDWRPSFTSKNRLRVSNPQTIFHHTFTHVAEDEIWLQELGGTAAVYIANDAANPETFDPLNPGSDQLTENSAVCVVKAANDFVKRETAKVIPYVPGKEQFATMACRFDIPVAGITRRIGMFNDENGVFFEDDGTGDYFLVVKKNGVETVRVGRNAGEWNGDDLTGTGRSQIVANPVAQQLLGIEYEWYGSGQVKFGYVIDGEFHVIHTVNNANSTVGTWTRTPFLPLRQELFADGTYSGPPQYFYLSSSSVIAEGGVEDIGTIHNAENGLDFVTSTPNVIIDTTTNNLTLAKVFYPLVSIRLKDISLSAAVKIMETQVSSVDNTNLYFLMVRNATLTGATFADQGEPYSAVEVDTAATAASFTKDDIIFSGASLSGSSSPVQFGEQTRYQLRRKFVTNSFAALESDVVTIVAASTQPSKTGICNLTWSELY
jgi:hypothetical protein